MGGAGWASWASETNPTPRLSCEHFYTETCKLGDVEYQRSRRRPGRQAWDAERLQALRRHLRMTQQQFANELGMRQQTVSEWETGVYRPRGASARLLSVIAEGSGFAYETGPDVPGPQPRRQASSSGG